MRAGKVQRVDLKTVVVGDILYFEIGDILPVDGLMLTGSEVKVDESAMTGETDEIKKLAYSEVLQQPTSSLNVIRVRTPFLISGTKVDDGNGTMLVLAVGEWTAQGKLKKLLEVESNPTPLQQKLEGVAEDIG